MEMAGAPGPQYPQSGHGSDGRMMELGLLGGLSCGSALAVSSGLCRR